MDYVVGFRFTEDKKRVVLLEKKRPAWQVGLMNGPGGKVRDGEHPVMAMVREFEEEAGAKTTHEDWRVFCTLNHRENLIHFFVSFGEIEVKTTTDEPVAWYDVDDPLMFAKLIENSYWLWPMALDDDRVIATVIDPS